MEGEEQQLRYSQGPGDDFKQILDTSFNEMMKDGVFLGQETSQSCLEFLGPRRQDSFTSFNLLSGTYSFGQVSQKGDENEVGAGKKKDNRSLQALLGGKDPVISLDDADPRIIAAMKATKDKKTLKKLTATTSKQDLFFDFMVDLFSVDQDNNGLSNKFFQRALHTSASGDQDHNQLMQLAHNESGQIYQSALKEKNLIESIIMPSSNKQMTGE